MPVVPLDTLPDASRVWVFAADRSLDEGAAAALMTAVDEYLPDWKAHGMPLTVSSQLLDDRFLVVAVDQSTAGASGCSIDGLFRMLRGLEPSLGATLVGGGRIFYRDLRGRVQSASRDELAGLVAAGAITRNSVVFDTTITDLGTFRAAFEKPAKDSWIKDLVTFPS